MGRGRSIVAFVALGAATIACDGGSPIGVGRAAAPAASRIEATGAVPTGHRLGLMDGRLIGLDNGGLDSTKAMVVVSDDDGRTWRAAELPDRPEELELAWSSAPFNLYVADDVAAVVGRDAASAVPGFPRAQSQFIVWTSTDGEGWTAHRLDTTGGLVSTPVVTSVGPLLMAAVSSEFGFNLFTGSDRGTSWQRADVSGLDAFGKEVSLRETSTGDDELWIVVSGQGTPEGGSILTSDDGGRTWVAETCGVDCPEARALLHRDGGETSTDGGRTWHEIEIDPAPPPGNSTSISAVVEVEGGWLASVQSNNGEDGYSYGMLLRSDDGRSWRHVLPPDLCQDGSGRPHAYVGDPTRYDGRWYVTHSCPRESTGAAGSGVVYVAGADGKTFEPVRGTERDGVEFGDPIVDDDRLLIPELGDKLVAVTTIE